MRITRKETQILEFQNKKNLKRVSIVVVVALLFINLKVYIYLEFFVSKKKKLFLIK